MKNEYYIPNTSGKRISFDEKEYIFTEAHSEPGMVKAGGGRKMENHL